MKKTEAKEEGVGTLHIRVVHTNKRKKRIIYGLSALALLIVVVFAFTYASIQPRVPRFMLDDLYVDSVSNSSVLVKLSSTNPSPKASIHYNKISVCVWVKGNFETEKVYLESTHQEPHEVTTWTAIVASNSGNYNEKPSGSFQIRDGVANGDVIADLKIQWKSGIFSSSNFSLRVTCPVLLNLRDLTSAVSKPMSSCSSHFT